MKITIITPFDSANFGAFLQAYCLKMKLESMGHQVRHMRTRDQQYLKNLYYSSKPQRKKDILFYWRFKQKKAYGQRKMALFQKDQQVFQIAETQKGTDMFILGSDEIWNIQQKVFRQDYFWGIGLHPAVAYAVSIGNADMSLFQEEPRFMHAVQQLNRVLVRDVRTKQFAEAASVTADIVCDPTMLVPVDSYGQELEDSYIRQHRCFLVYAYYVTPRERKAIQNYAKRHKMKTVSACFWHGWCDYQCECGPLQFSSLIRQCHAVFTTTFHGSIFSILNRANFVSVPISQKTNLLLEQFDLENRLLEEQVFSEKGLTEILDGQTIDFACVEEKISLIRADSTAKLQEAIDSVFGGRNVI